jgi:outer membrane protein OmpA-like peptidoglycan-associated protein
MKSLALLVATCAAVMPAAASADVAAPHRSNILADVHFRFDSAALPDKAASLIRPAVAYAARHATARIVVDAHCDPVGTSPYNAGLAVRRAESVRDALTRAGVPEEQVVIAVYGEDGRDARPTPTTAASPCGGRSGRSRRSPATRSRCAAPPSSGDAR